MSWCRYLSSRREKENKSRGRRSRRDIGIIILFVVGKENNIIMNSWRLEFLTILFFRHLGTEYNIFTKKYSTYKPFDFRSFWLSKDSGDGGSNSQAGGG